MRREDCLEMLKRIPEDMIPQVNLVLSNSFVLTIEAVARLESTYIVFRGREGGTSDEGRAFFVPYEEICYIRIEREVRMGELKRMFGETGFLDSQDRLNGATVAEPTNEVAKTAVNNPTPPPVQTPTPIGSSDPGSIAKQNLLDRIRATRANVAGGAGKAGGGK
jgi:hypothetical protein